jgi:hypothetical protein
MACLAKVVVIVVSVPLNDLNFGGGEAAVALARETLVFALVDIEAGATLA